jgi:hypothetical protein
MLIAEDGNVVYVSRQLGHANPAITLKVYAHEFACQEQADRMSKRLQDKYGAPSERRPGRPTQSSDDPPIKGGSPLDGASRARTGDLLGAIQALSQTEL